MNTMETVKTLIEAFQYQFILKALLVGALISVCCSCLGIYLVLKKYSLIGDGLAHVCFATAALSLFLSTSPLLLSIPLSILAAIGILKLNEKANIHGDAAIGLISSLCIALGVIIASLANGFNVDLMSFLFGSILVISNTDVIISIVLSIFIISVIILFYPSIFATLYDEEFAEVIGIQTKKINYLMLILTAITIALGIRVVGTMLISSLIIFPIVSALQISSGFKSTLLIAIFISVICVIIGVLGSYVLNVPTGAAIVMLNAICFIMCFAVRKR